MNKIFICSNKNALPFSDNPANILSFQVDVESVAPNTAETVVWVLYDYIKCHETDVHIAYEIYLRSSIK